MKPAQVKLLTMAIVIVMVSSGLILYFDNSRKSSKQPTLIRVACVGDSITEWSKYPARLQTMLGSNYVVENFGVSGSTVLHNSDKPYMSQTAFQKSKDFKPTIVIIMLGTNDAKVENYQSLGDFPNDYEELVGEYDALPDDQNIWIVTPPPIYDNQLGLINTNLEQGVIPCIEQVANDMSLPTINVNTALTNHSECFLDGVHPNDEGAELIAIEINEAISTDSFLG
jgi:lysophospholipase L1-like esterase